ncbi:hypothetical protein Prum_070250 [Phytohabitans rumicis]|uniref:Uncharacterized protein n=1 Tax=Phytohabitans rumicis TaxID=1076125 RepID=A0A6V8L7Z7_9ACTN|nr:hypothetical protein Prum_070250 [Phytohabitans rumicis]
MTTTNDQAYERYRSALSRTASLGSDRRGSGERATWWRHMHGFLSEHDRSEDGKCRKPECGEDWPCTMVLGIITDLDSGNAGW